LEELEKLKEEYKNCGRCPLLVNNRNNVVFGTGDSSRVLIIGEAPGMQEDLRNEPFVGRSGEVLNSLLADIGLSRSDVYITNTILCRPPDNRNPSSEELENCKSRLDRHVEILDPEVIITLGNFATKYILGISDGITNIHDAWQDSITVKVLQQLSEAGKLPIRIYGMLGSSHPKLLKHFFKEGIFRSEKYTIRSVKAFIDGALGSRGAALLEPYCDDINNCGLILISDKDFKKLAQKCQDAGFQLCTHAIGDRGNKMVLDIYSEFTKELNNHRWRIEHAQMICDEDIPQFAKAGIVPSMQPSHCTSDMPWLHDRLGSNRLHRISRWQSFIDAGCKIPGGSDCPIEEGNPIFEYYAAVTRKNHNGTPNDGWQKQEVVSRIDALKMFTTWAAYGEFAEHRRGKIRPGFDADLTFLNQDITECPEKEILKTEVLGTMVAGEFIFNKLN